MGLSRKWDMALPLPTVEVLSPMQPKKPSEHSMTALLWRDAGKATVDRQGRWGTHVGSMKRANPEVPQSLPQLSFLDHILWPAWPGYLSKRMLPWDYCSQHQDVPKDS